MAKRTEVTLKLANVSRQSAQEVSDQLTAIWNNFDDGTKSLEYYADVITKLGATTASSSEEIAGGLEKFSSIARTVGLSYEYATSMLATIVARTRLSEDTVGTGLRTILGRFESLQQGTELDDGISLTKYTQAIENIGVKVMDTVGNLRDMDSILSDVGDKWKDLSREELTAFAYTVGGVRQYANLIALFDDWDNFLQNLRTALMSEGTLQEQQDIYAESWEAARDRVKAAAESIYNSLLDDDVFIKLTDRVAGFLNILEQVLRGLGGLPGILSLVLTIATRISGSLITNGLRSLGESIKFFINGREAVSRMKAEVTSLAQGFIATDKATLAERIGLLGSLDYGLMMLAYNQNAEKLNETEKLIALAEILRILNNSRINAEKALEVLNSKEELETARDLLETEKERLINTKETLDNLSVDRIAVGKNLIGGNLSERLGVEDIRSTSISLEQLLLFKEKDINLTDKQRLALDVLIEKKLALVGTEGKEIDTKEAIARVTKKYEQEIERLTKEIKENGDETGILNRKLKALEERQKNLSGEAVTLADRLKAQKVIYKDWANVMTSSVGAISSLGFTLSSLNSVVNTLNNPDLSGWEKFLSVITSVGFTIPSLIAGFNSAKEALAALGTVSKINLTLKITDIGLNKLQGASLLTVVANTLLKTEATNRDDIATEILQALKEKDLKLSRLKIKLLLTETIGSEKLTTAKAKEAAALQILNTTTAEGLAIAVPYLLAIAAIIGVIIGIVHLVKNYKTEQDKLNESIENHKKLLSEQTNAAQEAASAVEDLTNSWDSLKSAEDTLNGLVRGTAEWSQLILKINQLVLDLIDKYPELSKYLDTSGDYFTIDPSGWDEVLEKQLLIARNMLAEVLRTQGTLLLEQYLSRILSGDLDRELGSTLGFEGLYRERNLNARQERVGQSSVVGFSSREIAEKIREGLESGTIDIESSNLLETFESIFGPSYSDLIQEHLEDLTNLSKSINKNIENLNNISRLNDVDYIKAINEGRFSGKAAEISDIAAAIKAARGDLDLDNRDERAMLEALGVTFDWNGSRPEELSEAVLKYYAEHYLGLSRGSYSISSGGDVLNYGDNQTVDLDRAHEFLRNQYQSLILPQDMAVAEELIEQIRNDTKDLLTEEQIRKAAYYNALTSGESYGFDKFLERDELNKLLSSSNERVQKEAIAGLQRIREAYDKANAEFLADYENNLAEELSKIWKTLEITNEDYEDYVDLILKSNKALEGNREAAERVARANLRNSAALKNLNKVYDNYKDVIEDSNASAEDMIPAINALNDSLTEWFGVGFEDDQIADWLSDHTIQKALLGEADAIKLISTEAGKAIAEGFSLDKWLPDENNVLLETNFEKIREALIGIADLIQGLSDIDTTIDVSGAIEGLNTLLRASLITAELAEAYMRSIGYEPDFETKPVKGPETTTIWRMEVPILNTGRGGGYRLETIQGSYTSSLMMEVPVIKDVDAPGSKTRHVGFNASPLGGGLRTSSSSGGGSRSQKETKASDDEIDRYHYVKEVLEDISDELDKVSKAKDRAFGQDKLKAIDQEIKLYEKELKTLQQYIKQIEDWYLKDKSVMAGFGAVFDATGNISNYDALMQSYINQYNDAVSRYNAGSLTDDAFKAYEDHYAKFKDALSLYEETNKLLFDERETLQDIINTMADARLEKIQTSVEIQVLVNDDALKLIDFYLDNITDHAYEAAEAIMYLGMKSDSVSRQFEATYKGLNEVLADIGLTEAAIERLMTGDNSVLSSMTVTNSLVEALRQYTDDLISYRDTLNDIRDNTFDALIQSFDSWNDKIERNFNEFDLLNKVVEHYQNIIEIIGKGRLGISNLLLRELRLASVDNSILTVAAAKAVFDSIKTLRDAAEATLEEARRLGDEKEIKRAEDLYDLLNDKFIEATDELNNTLREALEKSRENFQLTMEEIIEDFLRLLTGGVTIDDALGWMNKYKEQREWYLDDLEKIVGLNALNRDILKDIDASTNIKAQRELRDLQAEITDLLASGQKLSQYDLDYLRKRYELKKAELAVDQASNNATTARLRRDDEGNWGYVYTADQAKVDEARNEYEKKLLELRDLTNKHLDEISSGLLQLEKDRADAIKAIEDDLTLTTELKLEEMRRINEFYDAERDYLTLQGEAALLNNQLLLAEANAHFIDGLAGSNNGFLIATRDTLIGQAIAVGSFGEYANNAALYNQEFFLKVQENLLQLESNNSAILDAAGNDINTYGSTVSGALSSITSTSNGLKDSIAELAKSMGTTLVDAINKVSQTMPGFADRMGEITKLTEDAAKAVQALTTAYLDLARAKLEADKANYSPSNNSGQPTNPTVPSGSSGSDGGNPGGYTGGSIGGNTGYNNNEWMDTIDEIKLLYWIAAKMGILDTSALTSPSDYPGYNDGNPRHYFTKWITENILDRIGVTVDGGFGPETRRKLLDWMYGKRDWQSYRNNLLKFATGGYTGDWGNTSGKLAVLHQKELVLNADDTKNFLSGVSILREITRSIDLLAAANMGALGTPIASVGYGGNQTLDLNVTIHAEFPNAVDHNEIEQALLNLTNTASQYANRRGRS